jgi:tetratricopeptide (TPR) repeat protein
MFFFSATSRVFADASAQLQQAEEYLKNNQYKQAEGIYKQVLIDYPGTGDALQAQEKLTCLYVTQGKEPEAQSGLQKLLTDFSQYNGVTTAVTHVADEYRNLGRNQRAIEIYKQVVAKWPGDEHAMWSQMGIAISNASIGNDSAAEAAFAKLCADYSGQQHISRAVCLVADNYRRLGKNKKAQDIYRYALGLPSAKPDAEFTLWSQMGLAISSLNLGDEVAASQAIEKLRAAFAKDNRIPIAICLIADEYRKFGEYNEACELYQYVVDNHPNAEHALWSQMGLAISNIRLGAEDAAQKAVDRLRADFGQDKRMAIAACMVADEYRNFRKHDKACELYQYVVGTWPGNEQTIWSLRGMALSCIELGDNDETEVIIKTLLAQYSGNKHIADVVYQIARVLKDEQRANELCQYVIQNYPGSEFAILTKATIGNIHIRLGDNDAAQAVLNGLLADFSAHPVLPNAVAEMASGYYNEALLKESEGLSEEAKWYYQKAIAECQRIVTDLPETPYITAEACYFVGICLERLGRNGEAIQYYQKVVDKWPDFEYAWNAQFLVGRNYELLSRSGVVTKSEVYLRIKTAYEKVIQKYPNCPAAKAAQTWLKDNVE